MMYVGWVEGGGGRAEHRCIRHSNLHRMIKLISVIPYIYIYLYVMCVYAMYECIIMLFVCSVHICRVYDVCVCVCVRARARACSVRNEITKSRHSRRFARVKTESTTCGSPSRWRVYLRTSSPTASWAYTRLVFAGFITREK